MKPYLLYRALDKKISAADFYLRHLLQNNIYMKKNYLQFCRPENQTCFLKIIQCDPVAVVHGSCQNLSR